MERNASLFIDKYAMVGSVEPPEMACTFSQQLAQARPFVQIGTVGRIAAEAVLDGLLREPATAVGIEPAQCQPQLVMC